MTITVSGRALLLLTTGLWICLAGPSPYAANAATDAHHSKKSAHHASSDDANKTAEAKKVDDNDDGAAPASSAELPPSVANANAQLAAADSANGNPVASDRTLNSPQAVFGPPPVIGTTASPNQLSDADRAPAPAAPPPVAVAATDPAPVATVGTAATSSDSSTWDKTSLIGKIFVACGALLTMASALRMLWA
jgi:hypothetical protein